MKAIVVTPLMAVALGLASGAAAQARQSQDDNALTAFLQCRAVTEAADRLACFDRTAATLETERADGRIAVLTRDDVEQTQRNLFGFDVSRFNPFGDNTEIDSITSTATSARQIQGKWQVTLEDGSTWVQTDSTRVNASARNAQSVTIRRAALGSYLMKIGDSRAFRVQRR